jgi:hypothetical protein
VDRVEYFFFGEETPPRAAASFLLMRIVFIEVLSLLDRFEYTPFLYLIPVLATWVIRSENKLLRKNFCLLSPSA